MQKIGILGGTFDPIHWGHLLIAETAISQAALEQVIWLPTPQPHYKAATRFKHRWEMVNQAIAPHPAFQISPSDVNSATFSYAVDALLNLQTVYPNTHWYWILGLDAFQKLPHWYRRQEIAAVCDWLVAPRLEVEKDCLVTQSEFICQKVAQQLIAESVAIQWEILQMPLIGISSSLIRQYCRDRRSIRYLVPESVRIYINAHNLYPERP